MKLLKVLILFFILTAHAAVAQTAQVHARLDSMLIFIGGQTQMTLQAVFHAAENASLRQLADTITAQVEIVETLPPDTNKMNDLLVIEQRYIITSFDTGLHYIPPIEVLQLPDGTSISTDPLAINVINPYQNIEVDEQSGVAIITDVRDVHDAPFQLSELLRYLPYILLAIIVIAAIVVAIYFYRKHKMQQAGVVPKPKKPAEPCHIIALRELEHIKEEKLWQRNLVKQYYSDLTDTLRRYVSARFGINAMESTTDEIIDELGNHLPTTGQDVMRLQSILQLSDFVKFAKHEPLPDENDTALKKAFDFVNSTTLLPENEAIENEEVK